MILTTEKLAEYIIQLQSRIESLEVKLERNRYRGFMPDYRIEEYATKHGMIFPFEKDSIKQRSFSENGEPYHMIDCLSYGCSSYGYDLRLAPNDFYVFKRNPGEIVDPKKDIRKHLEPAPLYRDLLGEYFIIPSNNYGLGYTLERLSIPSHVLVLFVGKSTNARVAIVPPLTPAEPKWQGHLTTEFFNGSSADVRVYANEGCVTAVFCENEPCKKTYADRPDGGKYQGQKARVTLPKV